jgi:hypothetical protein
MLAWLGALRIAPRIRKFGSLSAKIAAAEPRKLSKKAQTRYRWRRNWTDGAVFCWAESGKSDFSFEASEAE